MKLSATLLTLTTFFFYAQVLAAPTNASELGKRQSRPAADLCIDTYFGKCERKEFNSGECTNLFGKHQDSIGSIRVVRGDRCVLYEHGNCKGFSLIARGEVPNFASLRFNDQTTSIRCYN